MRIILSLTLIRTMKTTVHWKGKVLLKGDKHPRQDSYSIEKVGLNREKYPRTESANGFEFLFTTLKIRASLKLANMCCQNFNFHLVTFKTHRHSIITFAGLRMTAQPNHFKKPEVIVTSVQCHDKRRRWVKIKSRSK